MAIKTISDRTSYTEQLVELTQMLYNMITKITRPSAAVAAVSAQLQPLASGEIHAAVANASTSACTVGLSFKAHVTDSICSGKIVWLHSSQTTQPTTKDMYT